MHIVFANNAAHAFVDVLFQNPTWEVTRDAFASIIKYPDEQEYDDGAYVLVGSALIAFAKTGEPAIPPQLTSLVTSLGSVPDDLAALSQQAFTIALVAQDKLAQTHLTTEQYASWSDELAALTTLVTRAAET